MGMVACKECSQDVSTSAKVCPHCGIKSPGIKLKEVFKGYAVFAVILFIVFSFWGDDEPAINTEPPVKESAWYEGGTLHQKNALSWQGATDKNKIATCADIVFTMKNREILSGEIATNIVTVDDLKPYAVELKNALNESFKKAETEEQNIKLFTNQKVSETSVLLAGIMGWLK